MTKSGTLGYENASAILVENGTEWLLVTVEGKKGPVYNKLKSMGKTEGEMIQVKGFPSGSRFHVEETL